MDMYFLQPFKVWDNELEIKVAYQSPFGDWYEVSEMFPMYTN